MIGTRVGSYEITDTLGEGGMGAVYIARHTLLGKKAAVKLLLPQFSQNEQIVQRFFNEAKAATTIHHKGIIEVFDFGYTSDGEAFIVMELLDGESLTDRINQSRQLGEEDVLRIARQTASALAAAHASRIVHRDLKPDNLFLCPDSEVLGGERVKVLDFGIAKLTEEAMNGAQMTRTGSIMGSPAYMSPEQCRGLTTIDARSDVYALGCVIYHMATGRVPFTGEGVGDIIGKHIYEQPASPRVLNGTISLALEDIIMRCLEKAPDARPQSMDELIALIDHASAGAYRTGRRVPRAITSDPLAATHIASGGHGIHTTLGGAAAEVQRTAPGAATRSKTPIFAAVAVAFAGAAIGIFTLRAGGEGQTTAAAAPSAAAPAPTIAEPVPEPTPEPRMASFSITTVPEGAEVYRMPSGVLVGTTPFEQSKPALDGKVVFLVKKSGYRDARVSLDASGGQETISLTANPAVAVSVSVPVPVSVARAKSDRATSKRATSARSRRSRQRAARRAAAGAKKPSKKPTMKPTATGDTTLWAD